MKMKRFFTVTFSVLLVATLSMSAFAQQDLPEGAIARLGKGDMRDIAYSPDGKLLAMAVLADIWLYDTGNGQEVARLAGHTGTVYRLSFSPDGQTLASASDIWGEWTVRLWDVATHTLRHTLSGARPPMSFSLDSKTLAADDSRISGSAVGLWDVATGEPLQKIFQGGSDGFFNSVSFSGDGQTLATAHKDGVCLYDVATGRPRHIVNPLAPLDRWSGGISFSPDGRTFITFYSPQTFGTPGSALEVWDISTGTLRYTLEVEGGVYSVSFSPDGQTLATASRSMVARGWGSVGVWQVSLWDIATGTLRHTLEGHTDRVVSVSFSGDGQTLVTGSWDKTVRLWDVATGTLRKTLEGHTNWVHTVSFSPDGLTLVSASYGWGAETVRLWDVATGTLRHTFEGYTFNVKSVSFSPDGLTLVSASDGAVRLWDVATGTLRDVFQHGGRLSVSLSPDGQILAILASASYGWGAETVRLWDAATGTRLRTLDPSNFYSYDNIHSVSFSPDGQILASGHGSGNVRLWDVSEGTLRHTFEGHVSFVNSVSFSPDGTTLASGSSDETVRLWDVSEGTLLRTLPIGASVNSVAFSPDGKTLANGHNSGYWKEDIHLWDVATGTFLRTLEIPGAGSYSSYSSGSVAFSPDGKILASASSDKVHLWDVATGTLRHTFEGHLAGVNSVAFSPDGQTLASASDDGQILLWRVGGWEEEPANAPASIQVSLLPQETALLANYPNPFNPETWIPYQLATPADVTLTIYNIQGRVVRDLDLGHQRAGMYHTRSRAAYWDGRNAQGESVASGIYFYTLKTGDFNATRKLLIRK